MNIKVAQDEQPQAITNTLKASGIAHFMQTKKPRRDALKRNLIKSKTMSRHREAIENISKQLNLVCYEDGMIEKLAPVWKAIAEAEQILKSEYGEGDEPQKEEAPLMSAEHQYAHRIDPDKLAGDIDEYFRHKYSTLFGVPEPMLLTDEWKSDIIKTIKEHFK